MNFCLGKKMETSEFESIRALVAQAMSVLGAPSKADAGYFRLQRNIDGSTRTTLAVYGDGIGSNLIEVAFNVQAIASCLAIGTVDAEAWVSARRLQQGMKFMRIPTGSMQELASRKGPNSSSCSKNGKCSFGPRVTAAAAPRGLLVSVAPIPLPCPFT